MSGAGDIQWRLKAMIADMLQERQAHADRIALIDVELSDAKIALDAVAEMAKRTEPVAAVAEAVVLKAKRVKKQSVLTVEGVTGLLLQAGPQDTASILLHFEFSREARHDRARQRVMVSPGGGTGVNDIGGGDDDPL